MSRARCALVGSVAALLLGAAAPALGAEEARSSWWSRPNGLLPGVSLPPPQDVGADELHVAGDGSAQPLWQAVAAVDLPVPAGGERGELSLRVAGDAAASGSRLRVCAVLEPFASGGNGAWTDVPAHDCARSADGAVQSDGSLVFDDVGELVTGDRLRALVVPGGPARVVLARPGPDALVTAASEPGGATTPPEPGGSPPLLDAAPGPSVPAPGRERGPYSLPSVPSAPPQPPSATSPGSTSVRPSTMESASAPPVEPAASTPEWLIGVLGAAGLAAIGLEARMTGRRSAGGERGVGSHRSIRRGAVTPI